MIFKHSALFGSIKLLTSPQLLWIMAFKGFARLAWSWLQGLVALCAPSHLRSRQFSWSPKELLVTSQGTNRCQILLSVRIKCLFAFPLRVVSEQSSSNLLYSEQSISNCWVKCLNPPSLILIWKHQQLMATCFRLVSCPPHANICRGFLKFLLFLGNSFIQVAYYQKDTTNHDILRLAFFPPTVFSLLYRLVYTRSHT